MSAKPFLERLREEEVILVCLNFITRKVYTLLLYTTCATRQAKTGDFTSNFTSTERKQKSCTAPVLMAIRTPYLLFLRQQAIQDLPQLRMAVALCAAEQGGTFLERRGESRIHGFQSSQGFRHALRVIIAVEVHYTR